MRELLDAGLTDDQVQEMLAADGMELEAIDSLLKEARLLSKPVSVAVARPVQNVTNVTEEKLYPMPEVESTENQINLPFVPFPIGRTPFIITSVVLGLASLILIYLLSLTL